MSEKKEITDSDRLLWLWATRAALTPEHCGEWDVVIFDVDGEEVAVYSGNNPRDAIDRAMTETSK